MTYFTANQSISHGTMRNEDLLQSFASALDGAIMAEGAKLDSHVALADEAFTLVEQYENNVEVDDEVASDVVNSLFDALNCYAPESTSFGSHEGDGSDYGFWSNDDHCTTCYDSIETRVLPCDECGHLDSED